MFRGIIIGVAVGYFFKPQIEAGIKKLVNIIRGNLKKDQ